MASDEKSGESGQHAHTSSEHDESLLAKVLTVSDGVVEGVREDRSGEALVATLSSHNYEVVEHKVVCLLYTSPSPRDRTRSRMPSSA